MPVPSFVPLVGSGFDSLANQGQYWAGFSAQQEARNLAAQQAQEQAANNWFARLAQMQQQENERRDRLDEAASEVARRSASDQAGFILGQQQYATQQQRDAEARRQFDVSSALAQKKFDWEKEFQQKARDDSKDYTLDWAKTSAPHVAEAGKAHDEALKNYQDSLTEFNAGPAEWEAKLPGSRWNPKTNTLEKFMAGKQIPFTDPNEQKIASEAAADLAARKSKAENAKITYQQSLSDWHGVQSQLGKSLIPIRRKDGTWGIRSPEWHMEFFPEEAPKPAPTPLIPQDARSSIFNDLRGPTPNELAIGGQSPFVFGGWNPGQDNSATQTATAVAPRVNEVTRITKDGRLAIFDANTKQFMRWADER